MLNSSSRHCGPRGGFLSSLGAAAVFRAGQHQSFAMADGQADRLGQPRLDAFADHDAIDDGLDVVGLLRHEFRRFVDLQHLAVDPRADEPGLADALDRLAVLPLAAADDRRQDHHPRAGGPGEQRFQDLLRRLLADRRAALVAGRFAQPGIEQPQVIVDLGDRGHRAAGIVAAGPLVDGDRRLQALDQVDVRPFELMEELPGVGREALDILPLAFGIERVEGQRALARPAGAGDDDQAIAGQGEIEVLQVVRPGAVDADAVGGILALVLNVPDHSRSTRTQWVL